MTSYSNNIDKDPFIYHKNNSKWARKWMW